MGIVALLAVDAAVPPAFTTAAAGAPVIDA